MSHELYQDDRFEMATFYQSSFEGMEPLRVEVAIPRAEYYAEEITRLSNKALAKAPIVSKGWDDNFGTVLIMREVHVPSSLGTRFVYDWRDGSSGSDDRPISIDSVVFLEPTKEIDGLPNRPLEFYRYLPADDQLSFIRMEDLTEVDLLENESLIEKLEFEFSLPTIELTLRDRMVFYNDLLRAAGISPRYSYWLTNQ